MEKKIITWHGKKYYLLGIDKDGSKRYLEHGSWDCGWYWGFGYVESFTNNRQPEKSKDISEHTHFDSLFFNSNKNGFDTFQSFFKDHVLTDDEIWKLLELMKTFYTARSWAGICHIGGSNYTTNPCTDVIKNNEEYDRINKVVIPAIMNKIYKLLTPEID